MDVHNQYISIEAGTIQEHRTSAGLPLVARNFNATGFRLPPALPNGVYAHLSLFVGNIFSGTLETLQFANENKIKQDIIRTGNKKTKQN